MATINEIANLDQYQGNKNLGGYSESAIQIDNRPIQQLAQYTFLYNRANWEQDQKNADAKIDELSKLARFNPINGIRKDTQAVIDAKVKLQEAGANYAREFAKDPKQRTEQYVKFKQEIGEAENLINSANNRAIAYQVRKNAILQGADPAAQKEIQLKQLDKEFDETDVYTKISALPNYQVKNIEVPKPIVQTFDVLGIGANENYETKSTIWNPTVNVPEADRSVLGIKNLYPKKGTPEYDKLSDVEKSQADIQGTVESDGKFWGDMAGNFNAVLQAKGVDGKPLYFDENGVFLKDKFEDDNAANTVVMTAYNGLKAVDNYSRKKFDEISTKGGIFDDKGVQYTLPGNLSANDFKAGFIDFNKGISPTQLGLAGIFSKYTGDSFDKKVTPTDNAIQRENQLLDFKVQWKNAETARINALKPDGSGSTQKPETVISQPAILFGEHINRLKSTFEKNNNQPIIIPFKSVDEKTRVATKLKDDQFIVYKPDGSYIITTDKKGVDNKKTVSVGTIDNLAQGFIDAVKTIDLDATKDKDGTMAEGFQVKSEAFFNQTFGTSSGKTIWDGWGKKTTTSPSTATDDESIPSGTILIGSDGKQIKTTRAITKKEAEAAGYKLQ